MKRFCFIAVLIATAIWARPLPASNGDLLLFYHEGNDSVTLDFRNNYVPKIREMAEAQGIRVQEVSTNKGAPELVHATPAVVFQNHLGRSLYIGRYHYVDKIKTFIRTVKRMPQGDVVNEKHDVLVWKNGRATVLTPVKVTPLSGAVPKGFDQDAFLKEALKAIDKGMGLYNLSETYDARRTDRLMYTAFYPYRSEDGKIFISMEVYSQFNCVDPVYKQFEEPISGSWKGWQKTMAAAAAQLEGRILEQLGSVERGDGFLPLTKEMPVRSFEDLGFPLPEKPEGAGTDFSAVEIQLAQSWTVDGPIASDVPLVSFAFGAPLDYYAGEISTLKGNLKLGQDLAIGQSVASFAAGMESLTMGDESLDEHVHEMIALVEHPEASFRFESVDVLDQPKVAFGALTQIVVKGVMDFKGIKAPLTVSAQIEPVLTEDGKQRLQVFASFKLAAADNYQVEGPDGPPEASNFIDFNLNFMLKPAN